MQRSAAQARHIESFFTPGYWQHLHAHPSYSGSRGDGSCNSSEKAETGVEIEVRPVFIVGFFRSGSSLLELLLEQYSRTLQQQQQQQQQQRGTGEPRLEVWGLGEDSPFTFEMYALQEELLQLHANFTSNSSSSFSRNKSSNGSSSGGSGRGREEEEKEERGGGDGWEEGGEGVGEKGWGGGNFEALYQEAIERSAQRIRAKMLQRYRLLAGEDIDADRDSSAGAAAHPAQPPSCGVGGTGSGGRGGSEDKVVLVLLDKMLTNYHNIGLLHLLFPKSLILHTVRDPLDTLLSCYANRFGDAAASYTLYRRALVARYAHYLRTVQHFRRVLPRVTVALRGAVSAEEIAEGVGSGAGRGAGATVVRMQPLVDVRYEQLVADPQGVVGHLLHLLGGPAPFPSHSPTPSPPLSETHSPPYHTHCADIWHSWK